jgi:hypothetical protein
MFLDTDVAKIKTNPESKITVQSIFEKLRPLIHQFCKDKFDHVHVSPTRLPLQPHATDIKRCSESIA